MLRIRERLYTIYAEASGQPFDRIAKDCDRNKWLDEKEMLEYGLVDAVLERMTAAVKPPLSARGRTKTEA